MIFAGPVIGGGDHDKTAHKVVQLTSMLKEKSVEDLRAYCLRLEDWERTETGKFLMGGLHDYINSMDKEACLKYIVHLSLEYKKLLDLEFFTTTVEPELTFLADVVTPQIIGGGDLAKTAFKVVILTNMLNTKSVEELRTYCVRVEKWERIHKKNTKKGGVHDFVERLNKDGCIKYLVGESVKNKELLDLDYFTNTVQSDAGVIGGGDLAQTAHNVVMMTNFLNTQSVEQLRTYCIRVENWERVNEKSHKIGGIHDYVRRLDKDGCVKYIITESLKNKELFDLQFFQKTIIPENQIIGGGDLAKTAHNVVMMTNLLNAQSVEDLREYCVRVEKWERLNGKNTKMGGVHDYVQRLDKDGLVKYIITESLKNNELFDLEFFADTIQAPNGVIGGNDLANVSYKVSQMSDYLNAKTVEDLRDYCVKIEAWERVNGKNSKMGGVHDYVMTLDKDGCIKYLIGESVKFRELLELEFFTLAVAVPTPVVPVAPVDPVEPLVGGLSDYIFKINRDTLSSFALTCERYISEKTGVQVLGGIHDKLRLMTDQEIAEYILSVAQTYSELNSYYNMQKLAHEYGIITDTPVSSVAPIQPIE